MTSVVVIAVAMSLLTFSTAKGDVSGILLSWKRPRRVSYALLPLGKIFSRMVRVAE